MSKVLVVDDDREIRDLVSKLLQARGHSVVTAENGQLGVQSARESQPDLIIMDLNMPVMDGFKATALLKSEATTKDVPVLILSAEHADGNRDAIYEVGCDGFISKPIDIARLFTRLSEFLE